MNRRILCVYRMQIQRLHLPLGKAVLSFFGFFFFSKHHVNVDNFYFTPMSQGSASLFLSCLDACLKSLLQSGLIASSRVAVAVSLSPWKCYGSTSCSFFGSRKCYTEN